MMRMRLSLIFLLALMCSIELWSQPVEGDDASVKLKTEQKSLNQEIKKLRQEFKDLRQETEFYHKKKERTELLRKRSLLLYGDLGIRYQGVFSDGKRVNNLPGGNEISRPEYRIRLGMTGFLIDTEKHRLRYDLRLANEGLGEFDTAPLGTPTVAWRPVDAFGTSTEVTFDRWNFSYAYKQTLLLGAGKFSSPFEGSSMLFDPDFGLTGLYSFVDLGRLTGIYERGSFDSFSWDYENQVVQLLQFRTAFYYLAQNNIGLASPDASRVPHGASFQVLAKAHIAQSDTSFFLAPGFHYFEGEEAIATNIGTGSTVSTTNTLNGAGLVGKEFRIAELYWQAIFFEERVASLLLFSHLTWNFDAANGRIEETLNSSKEALGLGVGVQWGAVELQTQGDFQIGYRYYDIPADALIPEFNSDSLQTNVVAHVFSLHLALLRGFFIGGSIHYSKREQAEFMGVGRGEDGLPGGTFRGYESRFSFGIKLRLEYIYKPLDNFKLV